jgi:hypothetical protein
MTITKKRNVRAAVAFMSAVAVAVAVACVYNVCINLLFILTVFFFRRP